MGDGATIFFIISLGVFVGAIIYILYQNSLSDSGSPEPPPPPEVPMTSLIGKACPVGCTCFPKQDRSGKQMCSYLDNDVMFGCPVECCTPSC